MDGCVVAPTLQTNALIDANCEAVAVGAAGSDRGPLALSGNDWIVSGDDAVVRVPIATFDTATVFGPRYDYVTTDLGARTALVLLCGATPCPAWTDRVLDGFAPLNTDGTLGTAVTMSSPQPGVFQPVILAGVGRFAVIGIHGVAFVDTATGFVDLEPLPPALPPASHCDTGASSGLLERFDGEDYFTYLHADEHAIVRVRARDGETTTLLATDFGSACNVLVSPDDGRFLVAPPYVTDLAPELGPRELVACDATAACPTCP
jgi:hypothetical protein